MRDGTVNLSRIGWLSSGHSGRHLLKLTVPSRVEFFNSVHTCKRRFSALSRLVQSHSRKQNKFLSPLADQFRGVLQDQVPAFQDGANLKSRQIVSDTLFQGFFIQLGNTFEK